MRRRLRYDQGINISSKTQQNGLSFELRGCQQMENIVPMLPQAVVSLFGLHVLPVTHTTKHIKIRNSEMFFFSVADLIVACDQFSLWTWEHAYGTNSEHACKHSLECLATCSAMSGVMTQV